MKLLKLTIKSMLLFCFGFASTGFSDDLEMADLKYQPRLCLSQRSSNLNSNGAIQLCVGRVLQKNGEETFLFHNDEVIALDFGNGSQSLYLVKNKLHSVFPFNDEELGAFFPSDKASINKVKDALCDTLSVIPAGYLKNGSHSIWLTKHKVPPFYSSEELDITWPTNEARAAIYFCRPNSLTVVDSEQYFGGIYNIYSFEHFYQPSGNNVLFSK